MASFEHVRQADRSVAADADDLAGVTVLPIYTTKRIGPDYPLEADADLATGHRELDRQ